jgi:divalent metal cation (Fe/Co/Zn/Cd) transporter
VNWTSGNGRPSSGWRLPTRQVRGVHQFAVRASGPFIHLADACWTLDPTLTLEEVHRIVVAAERRILERFPAADILIHADPDGLAEPHGGAFPEVYAPAGAEGLEGDGPAA